MPANVETMFSVRETPWHGLGTALAVSLWMPLQAVKPWNCPSGLAGGEP